MNREANGVQGIQPLDRNGLWNAVDVLWCDGHEVDGYLAADFYGEVLECGWYYEPLMRVGPNVHSPREHCEGPRGPYVTSEQALDAAIDEALCSKDNRDYIGGKSEETKN